LVIGLITLSTCTGLVPSTGGVPGPIE
jgi:hypothetical protein